MFSDRDLEVLEEMAGVLENGLDRLDELKRAAVRQRQREGLWRMRDRDDIDAFALRETLLGLGYRPLQVDQALHPEAFAYEVVELEVLMQIGASMAPRRHACSQGAAQMRPQMEARWHPVGATSGA